MASAASRRLIQAGKMDYTDVHLSHFARGLMYGFYGDIDLAVVEVTRVRPDGSVVLSASVVPAQTSGLFLYGTSTALVPFGNGFKCIGSPTRRLPITAANATSLVHPVNLTSGSAAGIITPGTTWYFQAWFRDNAAGGSSTGLSDGLRLTFLP